MAKSKSFLQEAVVAAKEVREAAIQHAYKELEENLTPSIKEALAQKLEEDLDIEGLEESNGAVAGFKPVKEPKPKKEEIKEEDEKVEDEETEETEEEETIEEPEEDTEVPEESKEDDDESHEEHEEAESDEEEAEEHEEPSDDTELKDLTLGDLKELIASMVSAIAPEKPAEQPEDMVPADVEGQGDEDAPIQPSDEEGLDIDMTADKEEGDKEEKEEDDVEINLDELLKELESEEHDRKVVTHKEDSEFQKELDETKQKLEEANATIEEMTKTLKSVNLLNAKLMCTSKLLSKPLTESQKARTIKSLDEAQSAKEVKAIYRTLVESFNSEAKTKKGGLIREHKGSASRAAGKSTAAPIVEVDPMVRRFQQLAGIID